MIGPNCSSCHREARLTTGEEIYPHRQDLWNQQFYKCDSCGGYVGCHKGGITPYGTPANAVLRRARTGVHKLFDPIWLTADLCGAYAPEDNKARWTIRKAARTRLYGYLSVQLDIPIEDTHIGMFDLELCRRATEVLRNLTYLEVRAWAKARKEAA